jgi:hypothetical protein
LGLDVLGFMGRCSARLVSEVVELALLCPSLEVAHRVLARRGIGLDVKTLRRLCADLGRSQLLSGRWDIFMHKVACLTRQLMEPLHGSSLAPDELPLAA